MPAASSSWRPYVAALVVLIVAFQLWKEVLEDRLMPKRWGVVETDSVYRSGQLHQSLVESTLADNQIDVIINMNNWRPDKVDHVAEERAADLLGIEKYRFPMGGNGEGDPENYVQALDQLHRSVQNGQRVLVHCTAGSQRTGAVVALYRVLFQARDPATVVSEMADYAFDPVDDVALLHFMDSNMRFITRRLVELGALDAIPDPLPRLSD